MTFCPPRAPLLLLLGLGAITACGATKNEPGASGGSGGTRDPSAGAPAGGTATRGGSESAGNASGGSTGGGRSSGGAAGAGNPATSVTYEQDEETVLVNPERGFYHHLETRSGSYTPLGEAELRAFREEEGVSLALRLFYLERYVDGELPAAYLAKLTADFDTARAAGSKLVLRFAYTDAEAGNDATPERVLAHVEQLAPLLTANADVIATVQAGLIGAWGEWYYTSHFGNAGVVSAQDFENRKAVVDALLQALPESRTVQLRTPTFKRRLYGTTALGAATAWSGAPASRLGHHNDAFVADATDMGTYSDLEVEVPYLAEDSAWVPVGGENNQYLAPRTACPSALAELEKLHVSFLNTDFLAATIAEWKAQGCYAVMQRRLGYRLALVSATLDRAVRSGERASVSLELRNDGFAAPYNPRAVELVLKAADGALYRAPLQAEPRAWQPGAAIHLTESVSLPGVPPGQYELFLALPDPVDSLRVRPEYSIRLANPGAWDEALGANRLNAELEVRPAE